MEEATRVRVTKIFVDPPPPPLVIMRMRVFNFAPRINSIRVAIRAEEGGAREGEAFEEYT